MRPMWTIVAGLLLACGTTTAWAGFLAADLVYVPVVAHTEGDNGTIWRSDVYITNVDDVPVDVAVVYLPSGLFSNAFRVDDRTAFLGGRDEDHFGIIEQTLAGIPSGGTVVLEDPVGTHWADDIGQNGNGALIVFAYEADTLEDDGSRIFRNVVVESRTYNVATILIPDDDGDDTTYQEVEGSYGQTVPGVPWYNTADLFFVDDDRSLNELVLVGGVESESLRYNVGLFNASDPQTSLTVVLQPFQANGEPFEDDEGAVKRIAVSVPPLAHLQYFRPLQSLLDIDEATAVTWRITIVSANSTASEPQTALTAYGSVIDNSTGDPTTILPSFVDPYPSSCVWPTDDDGGGIVAGPRPRSRRLDLPAVR